MNSLDCYKIVNGKAYTTDNILIKNLKFEVPIMTPQITNEVSKYFQKFGKIEKINFCNERQTHYSGTVQFADCKAAARVLQKENHYVEKTKIHVDPNYSWKQPDGKAMLLFLENFSICYKEPGFISSTSNNLNKTSLSALNEDCLRCIYSYLTLENQINLTLTSQRFLDIFKNISICIYKSLETKALDDLPIWQKLVFVKIVGKFVETLHISHYVQRTVLKHLGSCCINVKTLILNYSDSFFYNSIEKMKFLLKLTIDNIDIDDNILLTITKACPNLKSLSLKNTWNLTGKHIIKFHDLEELCIENCKNLCERHLTEIFRVLKSLRHLTIIENELKENHGKTISKNLLKLESLKLGIEFRNLNEITKLPKLKKIEIKRYIKEEREELLFFEDLFKNKRKELEELKLYDSNWINLKKASLISALKNLKVLACPNNLELDDTCLEKLSELTELEVLNVSGCNLTNDGVLYLIKHCPKLKLLELTHMSSLTDTLSTELVPILKKQHVSLKRQHCLEVRVDEGNFSNVLYNNAELTDSSNILKITLIPNVSSSGFSDEEDNDDEEPGLEDNLFMPGDNEYEEPGLDNCWFMPDDEYEEEPGLDNCWFMPDDEYEEEPGLDNCWFMPDDEYEEEPGLDNCWFMPDDEYEEEPGLDNYWFMPEDEYEEEPGLDNYWFMPDDNEYEEF